jgi:hypothetical protein
MVHVVSAKPLSNYRLEVTFNDGVSGVFHVDPKRRGGVFLKLLDERVFNAVTINPDFGCVEWAGGVDLDPEAMHRAITGFRTKEEEPSAAVLRDGTEENR